MELTTREFIEKSRRQTRRIARQSAFVLVTCMTLVDLAVFRCGFFFIYGLGGAAFILYVEEKSRKE